MKLVYMLLAVGLAAMLMGEAEGGWFRRIRIRVRLRRLICTYVFASSIIKGCLLVCVIVPLGVPFLDYDF